MGRKYNVLAIGDVHAPYHDKEAFQTAIKKGCDELKGKPNRIVLLIGDFIDGISLSPYKKVRGDYDRWADEIEACMPALKFVKKHADRVNAKVVWCLGNHEERLQRRLNDDLGAFHGMHTIETDLEIEDWGWEILPYREPKFIGNMRFVHDEGSFGSTALKKMMDAFPNYNVAMGHTHRGGTISIHRDDHVQLGIGLGWLGAKKKARYMASAQKIDWVHCYTMIEAYDEGTPRVRQVYL